MLRYREEPWRGDSASSARTSFCFTLRCCEAAHSDARPASPFAGRGLGNRTRNDCIDTNDLSIAQICLDQRESLPRSFPIIKYTCTEVSNLRIFVLLLLPFFLCKNSLQCGKEIQQLHLPLRRLNIGTYVANFTPVGETVPEGQDPFWPIATATMSTTVFHVVHMFSARGISAVPIIDEEGIVVNLYETVDVIVSFLSYLY